MTDPVLNLTTYNAPPATPVDTTFTPMAPSSNVIDLRTTQVTDGTNTGYLSSVFKRVTSDQKVVIDGGAALVTTGAVGEDGEEIDAPFDFKYDPDGQKFGAGTAFLQDAPSP